MNDDINISSPGFWDECYDNNNIGWDLGAPTPIFVDWCNNLKQSSKKICFPGSGNGYDALYFASKGHSVTAIDFADSPIKRLQKESKNNSLNLEAIREDIFNLEEEFYNKFDYIIEYTCYCAIDPEMRMEYINIMHNLLKKGGEFVGRLFPLNKAVSEGGPPFNVNLNKTIDLFSMKFKLIESVPHSLSIQPRLGNEQFVRFIK